jgi:hypothetical protein
MPFYLRQPQILEAQLVETWENFLSESMWQFEQAHAFSTPSGAFVLASNMTVRYLLSLSAFATYRHSNPGHDSRVRSSGAMPRLRDGVEGRIRLYDI